VRVKPVWFAVLTSILMVLASSTIAVASRVGPGPDTAFALDAPERRVALGVSIMHGHRIADLDRFKVSMGGRAPATAAARAHERGSTPLIWWEPIDSNDPVNARFSRLSNIAGGLHDDYIRRFARAARDFGSPVILRFAHEANGRTFPWGVGSFGNSAATFVAAWRHVHRIFRDVGASNVRFLWSVSKQVCRGGCNPYAAFYPGDAFVDYMGFSNFNWGARRGTWQPMLKGFRKVTNHLAGISSKPIIAVENACSPSGGDKAAWIRDGYRAVYDELPRIVGIVYLNVDLRSTGHPDWRLSSPTAALEAYAEIAALPRFGGRLPGT
jgi:hypothetical protein